MEGVAGNLDAHLEAQCRQAAFDAVTAEADAPLSVAVGLIVRQQLTGRELPPSAENVVQYWREHVLESAGEHIEALRAHVGDQAQFANLCRNIIADLGLPVDLDDPMDGETNPDDIETMDESQDSEAEFSPEDVMLDDESGGEESTDGEATTVEMDAHATWTMPQAKRIQMKRRYPCLMMLGAFRWTLITRVLPISTTK